MNRLDSYDKTDREYSLVPTDDLIKFWRSKVKGQGHSRLYGGKSIHIDARASKSIFLIRRV